MRTRSTPGISLIAVAVRVRFTVSCIRHSTIGTNDLPEFASVPLQQRRLRRRLFQNRRRLSPRPLRRAPRRARRSACPGRRLFSVRSALIRFRLRHCTIRCTRSTQNQGNCSESGTDAHHGFVLICSNETDDRRIRRDQAMICLKKGSSRSVKGQRRVVGCRRHYRP